MENNYKLTLQLNSLLPATKLRQGYIFTSACHSVNRGVCLSACWYTTPPWEQTPAPLGAGRHPPEQTHPPGADPPGSRPPGAGRSPREQTPPEQTPPWHRACWEIQSTRGQYASYWNAILLFSIYTHCKNNHIYNDFL